MYKELQPCVNEVITSNIKKNLALDYFCSTIGNNQQVMMCSIYATFDHQTNMDLTLYKDDKRINVIRCPYESSPKKELSPDSISLSFLAIKFMKF